MGSKNYLIPTGSMSLMDQRDYRTKAIAAGLERAADKKIGNITDEVPGLAGQTDRKLRTQAVLAWLQKGNWPTSLDVREYQPLLDGVTVLDQWLTAALVAVGVAYSALQAVVAPVMAANRLAVFYKIGVETAPCPISRVIFRAGGAAGNIIGIFDVEQLVNRLETDGYFTEPVVIDPSIIYAVQVLARIATGAVAQVQLGALIVEPAGQTIA